MARELRKFLAPEFVFGTGSLELAGQYARNLGARHVLLVTDPGVKAAGWAARVAQSLEDAGLGWSEYSSVTPNPRSEEVMAGAEAYRAEECDAVVAVGGGSPMDCAKGIGVVASTGRHILEAEGVDNVAAPMPPTICIPTTGGTSADVSQFAIISNRAEMRKLAIVSKAVVPDVALIDPSTLMTMDPHLTACTALDALVHAVEAFLSTGHSTLTDMHALEAMRRITTNLEDALADPQNLDKREELMMGSLQAGLAFSNASLGAVHAMAHSLGGMFDLPHGECNAMLLDHVVAFNFPSAEERCRKIAEAIGVPVAGLAGAALRNALLERIRTLRASAGVSRTLSRVGVGRGDVPPLATHAMRDACLVTNPRVPSHRDIEVIYEEAL